MKRNSSVLIFLLVAALQVFGFAVNLSLAAHHTFDFFYFVLQWPASYCDTKEGCCFPPTLQPAAATDFRIHGLLPYYDNGSYPTNCNHLSADQFDLSKISDLIPSLQRNWPSLACSSSEDSSTKFWAHEWEKRGTCSALSEHQYFEMSLNLKERTSRLLDLLKNAGITPGNGKFYSIGSVRLAIIKGLGIVPGIVCNIDTLGNSQFYQVYLCTHPDGTDLIDCPLLYPRGRCSSNKIRFPSMEIDSVVSDGISTVVSS